MRTLEGKAAIITGSGSGMGRATALLLAQRGARVTVADIVSESAATVAAEIRDGGGQAIHHTVDVTKEADIKAMVAATVAAFGQVDILHNNASDLRSETYRRDFSAALDAMDVEAWNYLMSVNLLGPMLGCKWAIPEMVKRGGGVIINTSSNASLGGQETTFAYGVAKGGLNTLTLYVATAYGRNGIRCNAIVPGLIMTPPARQVPADTLTPHLDNLLTPYPGEPEDVAYLVAFLVSDEARYITGQLIPIDGGTSAHAPWYSDLRLMRAAVPTAFAQAPKPDVANIIG
jgi:NAD(P)-dependent dehydrogenase (short-subunit alcohol dehydrogenase family)